MDMNQQQIWDAVRSQAVTSPAIFGQVDFDSIPERFVGEPGQPNELASSGEEIRNQILAEPELMSRIRAYTFMGDRVCDPYAALMPEFGFRRLVEMLDTACRQGIEAVPEAPAELRALIAAMEARPNWVDIALVEEGARLERAGVAIMSPVAIRAAFIATFVNRYAALPMSITGALSSESAARRVKETATFFATSVLPGALERKGDGFRAAAMVRLMHSMVRYNAMRKGRWEVSVYGIPIPQVDQMPAGLMAPTMMATAALTQGRETFTAEERARVELARYRCFLLGLPEDLLGTTPREIVTLMAARQATLRPDFDSEICGSLLTATMGAYLPADRSLRSRIFDALERGFTRVFFVKAYAGGDAARAASMGVVPSFPDKLCFALLGGWTGLRMAFHATARKLPALRDISDRRLVTQIRGLLEDWGHAHFTTDAAAYGNAPAPKG